MAPPTAPKDHETNGANSNGNGNGNRSGSGSGADHDHDRDPEDAGDPSGGLGLSLPELEPAPAHIAELVAACGRFVASKYKVALDGTPETLSLVDQYVRDAREAIKERPETLELVAPAVGAYLGEVFRHAFGAEWIAEGSHDTWRLCFTQVFLAFNPLGMAREALTLTDEAGWHAHLELDPAEREIIEQRLASMPEVEEQEYYLPTTRFDVISGVLETLQARAEASGTADVTFTREDYE
jgi:hypothetical protein